VDFTREPIIETVITPKEGCKLVVRSSKSNNQEEHFVDALEVVSFGHSLFFRSLERPKAFLVPVTDYEILEVREARMVLKNVGIDRAIKIGGGREGQMRPTKEQVIEKAEISVTETTTEEEVIATAQASTEKPQEGRIDKKRDRRRNYRRRRGSREGVEEVTQEVGEPHKVELPEPIKSEEEKSPLAQQVITTSILTSLLPPPPTLISETIARYKDNILFKDAFYVKEGKTAKETEEETIEGVEEALERSDEIAEIPQPEYDSFGVSEEEEIYQRRKQQSMLSEEEAEDQKEDHEHHEHDQHEHENSHQNESNEHENI
jgi:hypothetical protein